MTFFYKNIDNIRSTENSFVFEFGDKNNFVVNFVDLKKVFISFKKVSDFYFFDLVSLALTLITLSASYYFSSRRLLISGAVLVALRAFYLVHNATYYVTVMLKNDTSFVFYFSKDRKFKILEKIKIIRGKISEINFNV